MDMLRFSTNAASCVQGSSARMDCAIPIPKQAQYEHFSILIAIMMHLSTTMRVFR